MMAYRIALPLLCALSLALVGWVPVDADVGIMAGGTFTVAGKVTDTHNRVVAGAEVRLWKATAGDDGYVVKTTDSRGLFNFTVSATAGRLELLAVKTGYEFLGGVIDPDTTRGEATRGGLAFWIALAGVYDQFELRLSDEAGLPTATHNPATPSPTRTNTPEPIFWPTATRTPTPDLTLLPPFAFVFRALSEAGEPVAGCHVCVDFYDDQERAIGWTGVNGELYLDVPRYSGPYNPYVTPPAGWECLSVVYSEPGYEDMPTPTGGNPPCLRCFKLPLDAGGVTVTWTLRRVATETPTGTPTPTATWTPAWTPTATVTPSVIPTSTPTPIPSPEPVERIHFCGDLVRWSDGHWTLEGATVTPGMMEGR